VSLLGRALGLEQRATSTLANPSAWLSDALGGSRTYTGRSVSVRSALELVPVYSAVSLLAGSIGSLPLIVYRKLTDGRERAENHWMWPLLHQQPNDRMAADELWELVGAHLLLWGNAFLWKEKNAAGGTISALYPIEPSRVAVGLDEQGSYFVLDGEQTPLRGDQILHIRGLGVDGLVGLSPIQQARQMLSGGMAIEEFTGRFWANSAAPSGILKHPNQLSKEAADRLRIDWKNRVGGLRNAGDIAVLEEGLDWQSVSMPLEDAQFIETNRFNDLRVAQLFRIPPYMLGASSGDSLTYSNTEMQGIDFVRWSLRRWLVRIENSLLRDPSMFLQGQRFYPEFLVDGLLRSSTKDRYDAYKIALDGQFLTVDEVRERENLPALPPASTDPQATDGGMQ
jgi:HK97 family phage portal protein